MNISYNWLRRYLDTDRSAEEIATILTDIGLEVEGFEKIESIKGGLAGVVVGEVLTCVDHPDSDHLHITTVDVGTGTPLQIVCGAPNCRQGLKVLPAQLHRRRKNITITPAPLPILTIIQQHTPLNHLRHRRKRRALLPA